VAKGNPVKPFRDRHHKPRTYHGMRILVRRINESFDLNECYTEAGLVTCILRTRYEFEVLPLGELWAERERVTGMVRALTESES